MRGKVTLDEIWTQNTQTDEMLSIFSGMLMVLPICSYRSPLNSRSCVYVRGQNCQWLIATEKRCQSLQAGESFIYLLIVSPWPLSGLMMKLNNGLYADFCKAWKEEESGSMLFTSLFFSFSLASSSAVKHGSSKRRWNTWKQTSGCNKNI